MRLITDRQLQEWEREARERRERIRDLEELWQREIQNVGVLSVQLLQAKAELAPLKEQVRALRDAGRRVAAELGEDEVEDIRLLASALDLLLPREQQGMTANMGALMERVGAQMERAMAEQSDPPR